MNKAGEEPTITKDVISNFLKRKKSPFHSGERTKEVKMLFQLIEQTSQNGKSVKGSDCSVGKEDFKKWIVSSIFIFILLFLCMDGELFTYTIYINIYIHAERPSNGCRWGTAPKLL